MKCTTDVKYMQAWIVLMQDVRKSEDTHTGDWFHIHVTKTDNMK
jgi:hypothetical protein